MPVNMTSMANQHVNWSSAKSIRVYSHNVGGMRTKEDSVQQALLAEEFDVLAGTVCSDTGYTEFRMDRSMDKGGGGVIRMHKKSSIIPKKRDWPSWHRHHPFLRNNTAYWKALKLKKKLRARHLNNPSVVTTHDDYKRACKAVRTIYSMAKKAFHKKLVNQGNGQAREFYNIIKQRRTGSSSLPKSMFYNGFELEPDDIPKNMALNFAKNFANCVPYNEDIDSDRIHDGNFDPTKQYLWEQSKHVDLIISKAKRILAIGRRLCNEEQAAWFKKFVLKACDGIWKDYEGVGGSIC